MVMIFFYFAEIRYRSFFSICSFSLSFLACYLYSLELLYLFARPFLQSNHQERGFIFTNLTEAFHTTLKVCFFWCALFLLPYALYQLWCFFAPSCYSFERVRARVCIFFGTVCLFLGALYFYFVLLPQVLDFLLNFKVNSPLLTVQLEARIENYVRVSSGVFLIVFFVFQTPLFLYLFSFYGYVNSVSLSLNRKNFLFFFILLSALLSPPDLLTQSTLFLFFWFFFECSVWIGFLEWKKEKKKDQIDTQCKDSEKEKERVK